MLVKLKYSNTSNTKSVSVTTNGSIVSRAEVPAECASIIPPTTACTHILIILILKLSLLASTI